MENCPICESKVVEKLLVVNKFDVIKCRDCGLLFTYPLPSDEAINEYYQGFLFNKPSESGLKKQIESRTREIGHFFNLGDFKFLDYGAGIGTAYYVAKKLGFDSFYYDIDRQSIDFAKERLGLAEDSIIKDSDLSGLSFDYIWSDNVIEHVKDPERFVAVLYGALKNGGKLVIKTPQASNVEALFIAALSGLLYFKNAFKQNSFSTAFKASFLKRYWHCEPPRHLYSFSKKSIWKLIEKCDIPKDTVVIRDYYISGLKYSFLDVWSKIRNPFFKGVVFVFALPLFLIELPIIFLRRMLSVFRVISGTGLIVEIRKNLDLA
ncbi:MAG: class I SAM-dependent methyltransferase [Bacteroidales bacterium]|nr:class I SAM-dependent methyltransferase [Bacteroidales bacterium]